MDRHSISTIQGSKYVYYNYLLSYNFPSLTKQQWWHQPASTHEHTLFKRLSMKANYIMVTWNSLDAAETVLGFLGSDRIVYSNFKREEGGKSYK